MIRFYLLLLCIFSTTFIFAQVKAVTENGDHVILYSDGTWKYAEDSDSDNMPENIPVNNNVFKKSSDAAFLLKSKKTDIGIWYNTKKWKLSSDQNNEDAEYEFHSNSTDIYGMVITEKMQIPMETLANVALQNAQKVAPDIKVTKKEYRTVNGIKVLMMSMTGTMQGIRFTYFGYYYSNEKGTNQFITYSSQNIMQDEEKDAEEFLNGLVAIPAAGSN